MIVRTTIHPDSSTVFNVAKIGGDLHPCACVRVLGAVEIYFKSVDDIDRMIAVLVDGRDYLNKTEDDK